MKKQLICAAALLSTTASFAQGYFSFDDVPGITSTPSVQVDLNPAMLGFVKAAAAAADPNAAEVLDGIENVRLRVYSMLDNNDEFLAFIDDASGSLERDGWQRVVFVDEEDAKVRIYMQFEDTVASGVTVMVAAKDDEAVLINIAGTIDPTTLGQLMKSVGAGDVLGNLGNLQNLNNGGSAAD